MPCQLQVSVHSIPLLCHVHFLLLQLKIGQYTVKMLCIPPLSLPLSLCFQLTGRTCHYGNQSLWCTDQVNLSSWIAKQSNRESEPSLQPSEAMNATLLFLSGVNHYQMEGHLSCFRRCSRQEIQECPSVNPTSVYQSLLTRILPHISVNFLLFRF